MIRRAIVASTTVLFMALALPLTAHAQSVFVLGGLSAPTGDYGDVADTGWLGAVGVTFPVGEAGLWAGAEGLYGQNSFSSDAVDENYKLFSAMGILGYDIQTQSSVSPYVFGGLGLMSLSSSIEGSDSESGFGWQLGGGVGFETGGNISPFVEARYQSASIGDEADLTDLTVSVFGIEAGVSIGLGD
ncbi:MAG TPA: outer membrane beta-barrel protein [Gemmatimonadota bacterium]|nr:outer membrane beta-barrel protein [Gemmatimonadota bacterium]